MDKDERKTIRKRKDSKKIKLLTSQIWGRNNYSDKERIANNSNIQKLCSLMENEAMEEARNRQPESRYGYCWINSCEATSIPSKNHLFSHSWIQRQIGDNVMQYDLIGESLTPRRSTPRKASIFRGLCSTHDDNLFRYIEGEGHSFNGHDPKFVNTVILRSLFFLAHKLNHKDQLMYNSAGLGTTENDNHKCRLITSELERVSCLVGTDHFNNNHIFPHLYIKIPIKSPIFFLSHWLENESIVMATGIVEEGFLHVILSYHLTESTDLSKHSEIMKNRSVFSNETIKDFLWGGCMTLPDIAITSSDVPYARESFFD